MNGLILSKDAHVYLDLSRAQQADFSAHHASTGAQVLQIPQEKLAQVRWLLAEPVLALEVLDKLPNLHWLQSTWAGVEKLLAHPRRDYILTNIRGVFAPLISEYVLAHVLAHERQLYAHREAQKSRVWFNHGAGTHVGTLRGKTVLVLGVGSIGAGLAQMMRHFGVRVLGVVQAKRDIFECDVVGTMGDLPEFLPQADYVVNTLPNTPDTQNIINTAFLESMKPSAMFINVGRGQAVVEDDLVRALKNKQIASAVLDVYRTEPLPPQHVFWDTPHLILTSHTAAPSFPTDIFKVFWDNYQRFNTQQTLSHVVDFSKGY